MPGTFVIDFVDGSLGARVMPVLAAVSRSFSHL